MAYLQRDILPKIDSLYKHGTKNIIIMGHSQGAAISFLLTSHFHFLQQSGRIPADIQFKTYCSAAPKPGNLRYAYEYESITRNGWSVTVVNAADWVPETPFSIQTLNDFNRTNPFKDAKKGIKTLKFPANVVLTNAFNKMDKVTKKAQRIYEKKLGKMVSRPVVSYIDGYQVPEYYHSNNYVRTGGTMIVLYPDNEYYRKFPDDPKTIFVHHMFEPYYFLAERL